jgi:endonuclease/exonuclease/phosphatase family metal-dependent hydrolase
MYQVVDLFEKQGFTDLVYKHDKSALFSCPSPITIPKWSKTMEELKAKRQRIDFIFADSLLQHDSNSGTILINEEVERISDHYPVVVILDVTILDNSK